MGKKTGRNGRCLKRLLPAAAAFLSFIGGFQDAYIVANCGRQVDDGGELRHDLGQYREAFKPTLVGFCRFNQTDGEHAAVFETGF